MRHLPTFQNAQFDTRPTIFHHFDPRRPYWWSFEWLPICMMFSASQSTLSALQILRNHLCWCLPTKIIQKIASKLVKWDFLCVIFLLIWLRYSLIVFLDLRFPIFTSHILYFLIISQYRIVNCYFLTAWAFQRKMFPHDYVIT